MPGTFSVPLPVATGSYCRGLGEEAGGGLACSTLHRSVLRACVACAGISCDQKKQNKLKDKKHSWTVRKVAVVMIPRRNENSWDTRAFARIRRASSLASSADPSHECSRSCLHIWELLKIVSRAPSPTELEPSGDEAQEPALVTQVTLMTSKVWDSPALKH